MKNKRLKINRTLAFCIIILFLINIQETKALQSHLIKSSQSSIRKISSDGYHSKWSPDGNKFVYTHQVSNNPELFTMNADGSNAEQIITNLTGDFYPDWSPDGLSITFDALGANGNGEVFSIPASGGTPTQLTNNPGGDCMPSWSPLGNYITHIMYSIGGKVVYIPSTGGTYIQLPYNECEFPFWSPDETKIVYNTNIHNNTDIYYTPINGGNSVRITTNAAMDVEPCWSPDGKKIVFCSNRNGDYDLYIANIENITDIQIEQITFNNNNNRWPDWSPDGSKITYTQIKGNGGIYIIDLDNEDTPDNFTFTDPRDNKVYKTIEIGTQTWFAENLNYETNDSWFYNDNAANGVIYGKLYSWNSALEICPEGWHLPNDEDYSTLLNYLGGEEYAGGKMKESGYDHWSTPNTRADNSSGFSGLPGGARFPDGTYASINTYAHWWLNAEEYVYGGAWSIGLGYDVAEAGRYMGSKPAGLSVRCIKDSNTSVKSIIKNNKVRIYPNPTKDFLNIEIGDFDPNELIKMNITNIGGKEVLQRTEISQNEIVNISEFENGIYFINVETKNGVLTKKFIKN